MLGHQCICAIVIIILTNTIRALNGTVLWNSFTQTHIHTCTQNMYEQSTNHTSIQNRPRRYAKSPTVQDVFQPIPGLISSAGVTGRWGLPSHAQNTVRWLVLLKSSSKATYACTNRKMLRKNPAQRIKAD